MAERRVPGTEVDTKLTLSDWYNMCWYNFSW
jgi:hypothetical protein